MVMRNDNDEAIILLAMLVISLGRMDDPEFTRFALNWLRNRFRKREMWNKELDMLFRHEFDEDDPEFSYRLYRSIRDIFRRQEIWDPDFDYILERSLRRPFLYRRRYDEEIGRITNRMLQEFTRFTEKESQRHSKEVEERFSFLDKNTTSFKNDLSSVKSDYDKVKNTLSEHEDKLISYSSELHNYFWLSSSNVDFSASKMKRYIPARIYISDPVPSSEMLDVFKDSLSKFVFSLGFDLSDDLPDETGSWFKKFFFKTKEALTQDEVLERVKDAEEALKIKHLKKPQAEANKAQAEATSALIQALKDTPAACIQVGSLLLVKAPNNKGDSAIFVRTLTPSELKELEENQSILGKPEQILDWLQCCQNKNEGIKQLSND